MSDDAIKAYRRTLGTLAIVFAVLKLVGAVDWSWAVVFAPFWVTAAGAIGAGVLIFAGQVARGEWR